MSLPYEKGVSQDSVLYDATPSELAQSVLFYLQRAGHFYCDTHYRVQRTHFPAFLLLYVQQGTLVVQSDMHDGTPIRARELALLDCRSPHTYYAAESLEYTWLHFAGGNSLDFARAIWARHGACIRPEHPTHYLSQMLQMHKQLHHVGHIDDVTASRRLHDLLCSLLYATHETQTEHPIIADVQQYLQTHLPEDLSTIKLSVQFHLSTSQLNRLFRAHTGQSPHEYLVNLRVNRAKTLLKETAMSVTEIAASVGYQYDSSFAALFRSRVGMSPRAFRNMPV